MADKLMKKADLDGNVRISKEELLNFYTSNWHVILVMYFISVVFSFKLTLVYATSLI